MPDTDATAAQLESAQGEDVVGLDARLVIFERVLPAVAANVGSLRAELTRTLADYGIGRERCADIALVATEAATNVVVHAYSDSSPGPLYAAAALDGATLTVSVCDGGHGMRPDPGSAGLGLGMALMSRLADEVHISSDATTRGTCVTTVFNGAAGARTSRPAAPSPLSDRGAMLCRYLAALRVVHDALAEETDALRAQAAQAMAHGRQQLRVRAERRAAR